MRSADHRRADRRERDRPPVFRDLRDRVAVEGFRREWRRDDRYDWRIEDDGTLQQGHDFLFDGGKPTPAYDALRKVLGG